MTFYDNTSFDDPTWAARRNDPETSHEAAFRLNRAQISVSICDAIVRSIRIHGPITDAQMEIYLRSDHEIGRYVTPSGLRTRRKKLERNGIVYDTGRRRKTPTGRMAICWGLA